MAGHFDIVYFADPRFPGGTSTAVANEINALSNDGCSAGFCPVLSPVFQMPRTAHPAIQAHLDQGRLVLLDPRTTTTAGIVLIHHPRLFEELASLPIGLRTDRLVLVLHHPPFNGFGRPEYDLNRIVANLQEMFGAQVIIAPVGPAVRQQLRGVTCADASIWQQDWSNLLDFDVWQFRGKRPANEKIVIGRHSRPQLIKWPATRDEAVLVYPESQDIEVRMLGASAELEEKFSPIPTNWRLRKFSDDAPRDFLRGLDFFVYFHSPEWVEAFGYGILEAIATGVPAILPRHFRPLFGAAAIYAQPQDVENLVVRLAKDHSAYSDHARKARIHVERQFAIERFPTRLGSLLSDWKTKRKRRSINPKRRVIFMTSDGVGLGHLTRSMAIASQLPSGTEVAFFTLSQAFQFAEDAGYLTQYVPFHRLSGAPVPAWNIALTKELSDFIDFFRPDTLVFDGNVPYHGLVAALDQRPGVKRVWVRRGLWAAASGDESSNEKHFDLVIEPEEFSSRFDTGLTSRSSAKCQVPLILGIKPEDRLSRAQARRELGLTPRATVVALMLGAGTNFDFVKIRERLLNELRGRDDIELLEIVPPLGSKGADDPRVQHRQISLYPAFRHSKAFDAMIASAGYNSFHENILGCVPTLFVANEAPEMDMQIIRARHAKQIGCAEMLRASDRIGIAQAIDRLLDAGCRAEMRRRMGRFHFEDGAAAAARVIYELSFATRTVQGFPEQQSHALDSLA